MVSAVESSSVQSIVGSKCDAEELSVGFDIEFFQLTTVSGVFSVAGHKIGEFHVIAGRDSLTSEKKNTKLEGYLS